MIGSLKGIVAGLYDDRAIIEVNGVGYLVFMGMSSLARFKIGDGIHLYIETIVREDAFKLFGFFTDLERAWFVRLQEVNGVGAKVALAILDIMPPNQIIQAIEMGDKVRVGRATGVGPKLAQRIVTELKGRAMPSTVYAAKNSDPVSAPVTEDSEKETIIVTPEPKEEPTIGGDLSLRNSAISALQNLGIGQSEAMNAVAHAYQKFDSEPKVGELVKQALKELKN